MIFSNIFSFRTLLAVLITAIIIVPSGWAAYAQGFYGSWEDSDKLIVFIDPGHGGRDLGARGATSMLEKNVTLKLAKLIKKRLSGDARIEVQLSRIDDIDISAYERIDMANSVRARLFVGIHTDGGMIPRSHPMKIFIWGQEADVEVKDNVENQHRKGKSVDWRDLQASKSAKSQELADAMEEKLKLLNPQRGVNVITTDRMLIGGLTMPAIIVEPIDLSNPQDDIKLQDMKYLKVVARSITDAIYEYLKVIGEWE